MENQSPAIGNLVLALSKAQSKFEGAAKSSDNPFFKSKYADLHECIAAAKPWLAENELAVIQTTDTDEKGIWVITTLGHSSGEWIRGRLLMKPKKDDDQGTGSSITYGRRYTFAAIVGLAQKDDDGNASVNTDGSNKDDIKGKGKPQPDQKKAEPAHSRAAVEQWLAYIDNHIKIEGPGAVAGLENGWKRNLLPSLNKFPADQQNELKIAYQDTLKFLKEREGVKA
ncbi:TPA: hypothetical protein DCS99_03620 [Candidatus Wolfebacteria bacterium]|nr:hypothetical protein [Candidatus Wolfebacteria bacterium]